jgi:hypothetical protein
MAENKDNQKKQIAEKMAEKEKKDKKPQNEEEGDEEQEEEKEVTVVIEEVKVANAISALEDAIIDLTAEIREARQQRQQHQQHHHHQQDRGRSHSRAPSQVRNERYGPPRRHLHWADRNTRFEPYQRYDRAGSTVPRRY